MTTAVAEPLAATVESRARPSRSRVAVIGLDSAEWNLIEPMVASGDLPHLARLRERGVVCRLQQSAPLTEQPWVPFLAGAPAPITALRFEPATYTTFEIGAPRVPPFYAQPGLRSIILDVPRMTLAYDIDGAQITGWGGHHLGYPRASRPAGLLTAMEREVGPHPAFCGFNELRWYDPRGLDRFTNQLIVGALRRVDSVHWLSRRIPEWDLIMTVSPEAHTAGQILWHGIDEQHPVGRLVSSTTARRQLRDVYKALDTAIGRLAQQLPADVTLIVCSLHGIKPNQHDVLSALLPEFLARVFAGHGLLSVPNPTTWKALGCPPVVPGISTYAARFGRPRSAAERLSGWLSHHARRRTPAIVALSRRWRTGRSEHPPETDAHPDTIGDNLMPADRHVANRYREWWPRMKAFALPTYTHGRVRINLRGRERDGIVPPDHYQSTCDQVEALVRACRNPRTGQSIVDEVIRLPAADRLNPEHSYADLSFVWKDCADALEHPDVGVLGPLAYDRTGSHSPRGFAFIVGPGIPHADAGERPALDLPPTIISLLGREPAPHLRGQPIACRR